MNIYSGCSEKLGAALTNPTVLSKRKGKINGDYPVVFKDVSYVDAESAYKGHKTGDIEHDMQIMTEVIACKLWQHKALISAINKQVGEDTEEYSSAAFKWLTKCSHKVGVKNSRWEGEGLESNFVKCLAQGYMSATIPYFRRKFNIQ